VSEPAPQELVVHLAGRAIGTIAPAGDAQYLFAYAPEIVSDSLGEAVLSMSLPVRPEPFDEFASRPFFEGILPEGDIREQIAGRLKISRQNSFGLLGALGRDCAGAVVILPADRPLGQTRGAVDWLTPEELGRLVQELPSRPLGIGAGNRLPRLSLAGLQHKAVLIRGPTGVWGSPTEDAPSTHLLKPQYAGFGFEDIVFNERFCMRVAECAGLPVARTELAEIGGLPVLIVERFDRTTDGSSTLRLHQEDLCQALGIAPALKYQAESGPGFALACDLLRERSVRGGADVLTVVRAALVNFLLGNSDAHGKNFAVLYAEHGPRLAPLYDIVSVGVYDEVDHDMAMAIGDRFDPDAVVEADWHDFSYDCGISYTQLDGVRRTLAERVPACAARVAALAVTEGWHRPVLDRIVALCEARARLLLPRA
jgi:serine/threonine-protein kinase HipA